ncbi:MAG: metal-dependent hydrolase [Dehalobacter sp.]|nr:metal-dependent hydrolase [Dehalobacter sp.]
MIFFGHIGVTLLFAFIIFSILREKIDYRFLIVGAILPDLIDKPIGHYIFVDTFHNGRIFGHTVLFVLLLSMVAIYVERKYHFLGISVLALGALMHQVEDQIWMSPGTSLWPTMGWQFPALSLHDYAGYIFYVLLNEPDAYVPEIAGLIIIAGFIYRFRLYRLDMIKAFLHTGRTAKTEKATAT